VIEPVISVYTAEVETESDGEEPVAKIIESAALGALVAISRYEEQQKCCNNALLKQQVRSESETK
jgi:hypothetical protein